MMSTEGERGRTGFGVAIGCAAVLGGRGGAGENSAALLLLHNHKINCVSAMVDKPLRSGSLALQHMNSHP